MNKNKLSLVYLIIGSVALALIVYFYNNKESQLLKKQLADDKAKTKFIQDLAAGVKDPGL